MAPPISSERFYAEYSGHEVALLRPLHDHLRATRGGGRECVFFAGDSSLDNKFWFDTKFEAVNGYEEVLQPPHMKADICYHFNKELERRGLTRVFALNTAVEATSLNSRSCGCLLAQDRLIQRCITQQDTLLVSIGGNDLALNPVLATVSNIIPLICLPQVCIERCACACPINTHVDLGCCGCGLPGCLFGTPFGWPPGLGYFVDLFKNRVENYVRSVIGNARPRRVVVCMIYYLDVHGRGSWADCFLCAMGYDCAPGRLQAAIRAVFNLATRRIRIPGVDVIAYPLFEVLDGSNSADYVQRVEPSPLGGQKMARALVDALYGDEAAAISGEDSAGGVSDGAVTWYMQRG